MLTETTIRNPLTRSSGYLKTVTSHSLQPYCGCTYGNSLCGIGCYVRQNSHVLRGREWGGFLEARTNVAEAYRQNYEREAKWARSAAAAMRIRPFSIFLSSATDPYVPQERRYRLTRSLLETMLDQPPDGLIVQTHSHRVLDDLPLLRELTDRCALRVHLSIETDLERLPGLPPPASSVRDRLAAAATIRAAGVHTVVTVSPLLPIAQPERFFAAIADAADAVVLDHFIGGDGTREGERTRRTALPAAMERVDPSSIELEYLARMVVIAQRHLPGRVGVSIDGFAGRYVEARG